MAIAPYSVPLQGAFQVHGRTPISRRLACAMQLRSHVMQALANSPSPCCPPFEPAKWDDREIVWKDKVFIKDHVKALFHVPLDLGAKMKRHQRLMRKANAVPAAPLVLCDERSPWGADVFIDAMKRVPGEEMTTISGTFLTKVFEGPESNAPQWIEAMRRHVAARGRDLEAIYVGHATCPSCAAASGKNYAVLFARVSPQAS
jgi:hypothetical protein